MAHNKALNKFRTLKQNYLLGQFLRLILLGMALGLLLYALVNYFYSLQESYVALFVLGSIFILYAVKPLLKLKDIDFARHLDVQYPELEESCTLLLQDANDLTLLQKLQHKRSSEALESIPHNQFHWRSIYLAIAYLIMALCLGYASQQWHSNKSHNNNTAAPLKAIKSSKAPSLAQIKTFYIDVIPPAYTGLNAVKLNNWNIEIPQESMVRWEIETTEGLDVVSLWINEKQKLNFKALNPAKTKWQAQHSFQQSAFYQLQLGTKHSELYLIEVKPDRPVSFKIQRPKAHTQIDFGQVPQVVLEAQLEDDYGIKDAQLVATLASGKGEGVSFTEKKIALKAAVNRQKNLKIGQNINLKTLGMKPGDELYLFIKAIDTRGQHSRSDVMAISMVDTTELMSLSSISNGVNPLPTAFRSQRQIIIDIEKLLNEEKQISSGNFTARSNETGYDQRLLRLRYGKFLGQESADEDQDAHGADDHDEQAMVFGNTDAIEKAAGHQHDTAEDATYFEPQTKMLLKAVLDEMWNSELKLRLAQPRQALPYAYKALRLLKDLQQKDRAYVAKTTIRVPALDLNKRFTGEQSKIANPFFKETYKAENENIEVLRISLALLDRYKMGEPLESSDKQQLRNTERILIAQSGAWTKSYLEALKSLRSLYTQKTINIAAAEKVQQALLNILGDTKAAPGSRSKLKSNRLAELYFENLKNRPH